MSMMEERKTPTMAMVAPTCGQWWMNGAQTRRCAGGLGVTSACPKGAEAEHEDESILSHLQAFVYSSLSGLPRAISVRVGWVGDGLRAVWVDKQG